MDRYAQDFFFFLIIISHELSKTKITSNNMYAILNFNMSDNL